MTRADRHHNPAAFTTDIAKQAGLELGVDYAQGDSFGVEQRYHTARLLGDPVALTLRVIDKVSFFTKGGSPRWAYIAMPDFVWNALPPVTRRKVVGWMYKNEGGTALLGLFK